ncbi:hypothetical protein QBC43DRAFT_346431 [Cladorrhinum sp. PSN259]|nr:hypothetical protein QBC43DRAFT_346431 [Cladorrhinum sp. PSN259]
MCNYTVDPDGDVILKLEYPNDPFAPEGGGTPARTQKPNSNALAKGDSSLNTSSSQVIAKPKEADTTEPVTFRVSSRHLILASPVFKSALTRGWKESVKTKGEFRISSQGWDATALGIFLNAIHCQYKQVPRLLELEMLAKVAVIVDYYAANQAMEILGPIWINELRSSLPTTTCHNRTIALWICVSWVFGDESAFEDATKVAIHHGYSNMTDFGLPIPGWVIEHINRDRKLQINRIFEGLIRLQSDLLDDRKGCGIECRTMQLGALTRLLSNTSLLNYFLEKPEDYQALSVSQLLQELGVAVCPTWYSRSSKVTINDFKHKVTYHRHECCAPGNAFCVAIQSITQEVNQCLLGLSIKSY